MTLTSLIRRRRITANPAAHAALDEACWYWSERAEDLTDDPAEVPELVAAHLADVADYLRRYTAEDDPSGYDGDPAYVSAWGIAEVNPVARLEAIADELDALAEELDG